MKARPRPGPGPGRGARAAPKTAPQGPPPGAPGVAARRLAIEALTRVDVDGAYANLLLGPLLTRSDLGPGDRRFATELVYGTIRMQRACDAAVDPYLLRPVDPPTRAALRVGAYQLCFLRTPAHAAVSATAGAVRGPSRGLVNAVLRRVAERPPRFDDLATELSYPDWLVDRLVADLGPADARAALEAMNAPAAATERDDGYVQDQASQWVADAVGAGPGQRVADLCAAPGGKATALAATGAFVLAADVRPGRAGLVAANAARLGRSELALVVADGRRPPLRPGVWDRVLVDAPCTGLGTLRRRPDARWRIDPAALERLVPLQRALTETAVGLLAPDGVLTFSVCTLTRAETEDFDRWAGEAMPDLAPLPPLASPWRPLGRGSLLLPQDAGTDGMYVLQLRRQR